MNYYPYSIIDPSQEGEYYYTGLDYSTLESAIEGLKHSPSWWIIEDRLGNRYTLDDSLNHERQMDSQENYLGQVQLGD